MCLAPRPLDRDDVFMDLNEPIYRKICVSCTRPALTLDQGGDAYCGDHAEVFIAAEATAVVLDETEITVLLVHRPLVSAVG